MSGPQLVGAGLAAPQSYTTRELKKDAGIRHLNGLGKFVTLLQEGSAEMKIGKNNGQHREWDNKLRTILKELETCKTFIASTKEKQTPLPEKLKGEDAVYSKVIAQCEAIEKDLSTLEETAAQSQFKESSSIMTAIKAGRDVITQKVKEKTAVLERKMEQSRQTEIPEGILDKIIARAKHLPAAFLAEEINSSYKADVARITRYDTLKDAWKVSSLLYDKMLADVERLKIGVSTIPAIRSNEKKLSVAKTLIDSLCQSIEKASLPKLVDGFIEKTRIARELSPFKASIEAHKATKSQLQEAQTSMQAFDDCIGNLRPIINKQLKQTEQEIKRLNTEYKADFSLEDGDFQLRLKEQHLDAISRLAKQRDQIEKEWNDFCFTLNEATQALSLLTRTQDYVIFIGEAYLSAESIYQTLRFTRLGKNPLDGQQKEVDRKSDHQQTFEEQGRLFHALCQKIKGASEEESKTGEENQVQINEFQKLCQQAIIPEGEIKALRSPATEAEAEIAGLVWSSDERKAEIMGRLAAQKVRIANESQQHNRQVQTAFESTLPRILKLASDELNKINEALKVPDNDDNQHYYQIYFRKSRVHRYVSDGITSITNGLSSAATGALSLLKGNAVMGTTFTSPLEVGGKLTGQN